MGELLPEKKSKRRKTSVKVIGVGNGGIRIVNKMLALGWHDLEYITVSAEECTESTEQWDILGNFRDAALAFIVMEPSNSDDAYTATYIASCAINAGIKTITAFVRPQEYGADDLAAKVAEYVGSVMCLSHTVIKPYGSPDTIHNLAELCLELFFGNVSIFEGVVQESGLKRSKVHVHFCEDECCAESVNDVGVS